MARFFALAGALVAMVAGGHPALGCDKCGGAKPAVLMPGLGDYSHPVSTKGAEAQKFFDQGLALVYGFNHEEAIHSFKQAAQLDPQLAMAHWGIALALGPNYNLDVEPDAEKAAYEEIQKARQLEVNASEAERGFIEALARR